MATELATAYIALVPTTRGIQSSLAKGITAPAAKAGGDAGRAAGESMRSGIAGSVLKVGAMVGGAFAIDKAVGFAKNAIIGFNSTLEQSSIAFTTMLGSAQKAQAFIAQLQAFAAKTPFEFQGLVQNAQSLMGMGVAAHDVLPDLTALGDSVASVGGSSAVLDNTISAFGQTMAKGTLDMGNMNQLLQGGIPNALKILAAGFHTTTGNMVKMISTGKVASAKALPLLVKGIEKGTKSTAALGGMMDKQSQTFQGAMSNISDTLTQALAKTFLPFFKQASKRAEAFATWLSGPQFQGIAKSLTAGVKTAFQVIGAVTDRVRPIVALLFDKLLAAIPVVVGYLRQLAPVFSKALGVAASLVPPVLAALSKLGPVFATAFHAVAAALPPIFAAVSKLAPVFVGLFRAIVAQLPGIVQWIASLRPVVIATFQTAAKVIGRVVEVVRNLLPVIVPIAKVIGGVLVAAWQEFLDIADKVSAALVPVSAWISDHQGAIVGIAQTFGDWAKKLMPLAPVLLGLFGAFKGAEAAASGVSALRDKITGQIDAVKEWKNKITGAVGSIKEFGSSVKSGATTVRLWGMYAKDGVGKAARFAKSVALSAGAFAKQGAMAVWSATKLVASKVATLAVSAATKAYAAAQWLLNAAMDANPLALVVIGLVALGAAIAIAWAKSETFRRIVTGAFDAVKSAVLAVVDWFRGPFVNFFTQTIPGAFRAMGGFIRDAFGKVLGFMRTWGPVALAVLVPFLGIPLLIFQHFGAIKGYLSEAFSAAVGTVRGWIDRLVGFVEGVPGRLAALAGTFLNAGKNLIGSLFRGLLQVGSVAADVGRNIVNAVIDGLNSILPHHLHVGIPGPIPDIDVDLIPRIPHIARGGMTTGQTAAIVGDNPSGNELIMPMDSSRTVSLLGKAMAQAGAGRGGATRASGTLEISPDSAGRLRAWVRDLVLDEGDLLATHGRMSA